MNIDEVKKWRALRPLIMESAPCVVDWLITEHDRLTAEKPLIAAQMLALDQERERVEGENAKLRELLSEVYHDLKQGAMPNYDDPWFNAARAALKA